MLNGESYVKYRNVLHHCISVSSNVQWECIYSYTGSCISRVTSHGHHDAPNNPVDSCCKGRVIPGKHAHVLTLSYLSTFNSWCLNKDADILQMPFCKTFPWKSFSVLIRISLACSYESNWLTWHRTRDKPLPEPMFTFVTECLTYACITIPKWLLSTIHHYLILLIL